jgi:hypothetical protein
MSSVDVLGAGLTDAHVPDLALVHQRLQM